MSCSVALRWSGSGLVADASATGPGNDPPYLSPRPTLWCKRLGAGGLSTEARQLTLPAGHASCCFPVDLIHPPVLVNRPGTVADHMSHLLQPRGCEAVRATTVVATECRILRGFAAYVPPAWAPVQTDCCPTSALHARPRGSNTAASKSRSLPRSTSTRRRSAGSSRASTGLVTRTRWSPPTHATSTLSRSSSGPEALRRWRGRHEGCPMLARPTTAEPGAGQRALLAERGQLRQIIGPAIAEKKGYSGFVFLILGFVATPLVDKAPPR